MMLYNFLEANDGMPDDCVALFANTGREMPQTLDFVRDMELHWGVKIHWLEYAGRDRLDTEKLSYEYHYREVDHASASRNGEPYAQLIDDQGHLPNPVARWCSGQLKVRTMMRYLMDEGFPNPAAAFIGLRADEPRRAMKIHNTIDERQEIYCPMYVAGHDRTDVSNFWKASSFDLDLPNNNGVTDWGNCDVCFLKGETKRLSILRERPQLADWWIEQEEKCGDQFRREQNSYANAKLIATDQGNLFTFDDDDTVPCFCTD
jgi:3'-phosphoadenosine 5'-phosphosulfate sulfotransferase (PAPS reductase)/FAD synthetase